MVVVAFQYACKRDLNALPSQAKAEGNVVVDQKSAEVAMNGAYSRLANVIPAGTSTGFGNAHEVFPSLISGMMQYGLGRLPDSDNNIQPSSALIIWSPNYGLLNAANGVIEGVTKLDNSKIAASRKIQMLAEARFLRAYAHFSLLCYFGEWFDLNSTYGVLLRKETLKLSNGAQARSTVKESYEYILQDIDFAIANAPDVSPNHYANKTVAKALKMRVLMQHGQAADYLQVLTLANEILSNPNYELEASLQGLMQNKGLTSKEVLLGIVPVDNQVNKRNKYQHVFSAVFISTPQFRNLLKNDPRKDWMLQKATNATSVSLRDSMYMSKFFGPKIEVSYVFRLTEVYLLKAEAMVRSGGNIEDAKAILKTVMSKSAVTDFSEVDQANTSAKVLIELYKEFSRNMSAEDGIDLFALLRLPFETVKVLRPTIISRDQYIFPIPLAELELNPAFGLQNPGYRTNNF